MPAAFFCFISMILFIVFVDVIGDDDQEGVEEGSGKDQQDHDGQSEKHDEDVSKHIDSILLVVS